MKLREPMPDLSDATVWLNGEVTREDLVGEIPTLIHFWSISCHLCKKAMPQVNELRDKYKGKLNVIAIHMPRSEEDRNLEEIKQKAVEHDMTQPIYVDGDNHTVTNRFENQYVPSYYLFDREGKLRHFQIGGSGMNMLEKRVIRMFNEEGKSE
ncbi:TlpA family protein disulfide reductase [Mesobacillus maritimus]|uniref:TlpA family protein disulfide reductase n=1 Tax=Mesobacillus maritimus TaxID=1643336 RepID=A0ABS7K619_9BACI|nr:TlpA disulfide reductase family protein [Mesobacillus maritimus]MBY0097713.1 TlpA family protein disulfide reductase [Mesobacillus maritimus]